MLVTTETSTAMLVATETSTAMLVTTETSTVKGQNVKNVKQTFYLINIACWMRAKQ